MKVANAKIRQNYFSNHFFFDNEICLFERKENWTGILAGHFLNCQKTIGVHNQCKS